MPDTECTQADMEPRKKRKVEVPPAPTSAFALRKRLQQQKEEQARAALAEAETAPAAAPAGDVEPPAATQSAVEAKAPKAKAKKGKKTKEAQPEEPAVAAVAPIAPPALAETPAPVKTVHMSPTRGPVVIRSSFQPNRHNFQKKANGHLHLKMADDQRLVILGSYGLTVREGEVTLAGAILRASDKTHWVHAPRCHALPVLRCTDDAHLVLQPHPAAASLRALATLSPLFQSIWNEPGDDATFQIIYTSDDCQAVTRDLASPAAWNKLIAELTTAPNKAAAATTKGVFFVCGPKASGKSTFARLLANRILTADGADRASTRKWAVPSLAVLDIDPGQPEYGTPGTLSLVHVHEPNLAPTFCHPYVPQGQGQGQARGTKLLRAHETAAVSPSTDPEHYVECVMDLFALYRRDLRSRCALVVNTPGWIQGTGLAILTRLAARMQPSKVIYMSHDGPDDTVQGLRAAYAGVPLVALPSQPGDLRVRTAAHLRSMQTMSYFHLDLEGTATSKTDPYLSWHASALTAVRPWTVPYAGPASGILGITCYDSQPPPHLIADTINGTVVSIVAIQNAGAFRTTQHREARNYDAPMDVDVDIDDDDDDDDTKDVSTDRLPPIVRSPEGIPFILNPSEAKLDPRHAHKLGIALVRGIDDANKVLHLLTPVPVDDLLADVMRQDGMGLVLVSGKFDVPTWAYTEDTNRQHYKVKADQEDDKDGGDGEDGDDTDNDGDEEGGDTAAAETETADVPSAPSSIPWVQVLQGRQTRDAGSQVWRVRRDLGRNTAGD